MPFLTEHRTPTPHLAQEAQVHGIAFEMRRQRKKDSEEYVWLLLRSQL